MTGSYLRGHDLAVSLPPRWEGRIYLRSTPPAQLPEDDTTLRLAGVGWPGERPHPVMHLANFALPAGRGDFGTGAVEIMGPRHVFIALLEFGDECLGTALYEHQGLPRPRPDDFHPAMLQRRLPGEAGFQAFFTENARPMCLFVVLGSYEQRHRLCPQVHTVLDAVTLGARKVDVR